MKGLAWLVCCMLFSLVFSASAIADKAPSYDITLNFSQMPHANSELSMTGLKPVSYLDFQIKNNALVKEGTLHLTFTPSPSLIASQSHLKVSLNDEYMGIAEISDLSLGQTVSTTISLNPLYIKEFNRLKLEFIGQYDAVCPTPASPALWLELSKKSHIDLALQMLESKNDLAYFPEPFFFENSQEGLTLPMVYPQTPDLSQVKAGAITSSLFGSLAHWRDTKFPVYMNELPKSHAIVFATNAKRPEFLKDFPLVNAPTIEMRNHPSNSYYKLLVIAGRDGNDLVEAAKGLAQGKLLLRGQRVQLDSVTTLAKRKPYDAPNWVDTSKPTSFFRLLQYKEQLLTKGSAPKPIALPFQLPPDLYLTNGVSIPVNLEYRYAQPKTQKSSFLNIDINGQFVKGFQLKNERLVRSKLSNAFDFQSLSGADKSFSLPSSSLATHNILTFSFNYGLSYGEGTKEGKCVSSSLLDYQAVIDGNSTVDFSNLKHFMEMPNLASFMNAAFPFSRLADLSETWFVIPKKLTPIILATVMKLAGHIGAQTGYPIVSVTFSNDWQQAIKQDADILYLGAMPKGMRDLKTQVFSLEKFTSWLKTPMQQPAVPHLLKKDDFAVNTRSVITSASPVAAVLGMQSLSYNKRSVVALLADGNGAYDLLLRSLSDPKWRSDFSGSVALIRKSGVNSLNVGKHYYVGHIPWWLKSWYELKAHPFRLAIMVLLAMMASAVIIRKLLRNIGSQRTRHE